MATQKSTKSTGKSIKELPTVSFATSELWEKWLVENFAKSEGLWLCIHKKSASQKSVTYAEALDVALCYGWIDGQKKPFDDNSWLQKFVRRRPRSNWSRKNTEHAERLIASGKMHASGLVEVEDAKRDGRWSAAYDSPANATIPEDFLALLKRNKAAFAFFETLNKANLYAISYRLQTAKKTETREKRMKVILEMLASGEKFH